MDDINRIENWFDGGVDLGIDWIDITIAGVFLVDPIDHSDNGAFDAGILWQMG